MEDSTTFVLKLPGFRFHPTDEELLSFYLKNMIFQKEPRINVIGFLNIYRHDPWDLPGLAKTRVGEREWYFFVPRDRKNGSGGRPSRTTEKGFWKATGSDRRVISLSNPKRMIGLKKTLVFYTGRAPRGCKTDWIMNEFRLPDTCPAPKDIVLCKIYRKATSLKVLEQRAEEESSKTISLVASPPITPTPSSSSLDDGHNSFCDALYNHPNKIEYYGASAESDVRSPMEVRTASKKETGEQGVDVCSLAPTFRESVSKIPMEVCAPLKKEKEEQVEDVDDSFLIGNVSNNNDETTNICEINNTGIRLPFEQEKLPELLVTKSSVDWTQDPFWMQLPSPWFDNWSFSPNAMNF